MDDRRSRLVDDGTRLLHADLHNHSLFSDGGGDPERAFDEMRAAGLDVAALTDHASIPHHQVEFLDLTHYPDEDALAIGRTPPRSIDDDGWKRTGEIADAHDVPGEFTALRGFEWTEPWLGHVNVWFTDTYLPVTTPGAFHGLHAFLRDDEPDALFGYNHPGREPGRLGEFSDDGAADLKDRMVALEAFNRRHDYLFVGHADGLSSPIVACLDAGWRPGLIGCSDEHGPSYGLAGRGRTGIWAREHSREGVREALLARRTFATREIGLRLDATLDGVRMGGELGRLAGARVLDVDLAGSGYDGRPVQLQLLASDGTGVPAVVATADARVGEVAHVEVDLPEAAWTLLRVADPTRPSDTPGPRDHPASCWALAYASPWWPA
jgi:hypothetical protein